MAPRVQCQPGGRVDAGASWSTLQHGAAGLVARSRSDRHRPPPGPCGFEGRPPLGSSLRLFGARPGRLRAPGVSYWPRLMERILGPGRRRGGALVRRRRHPGSTVVTATSTRRSHRNADELHPSHGSRRGPVPRRGRLLLGRPTFHQRSNARRGCGAVQTPSVVAHPGPVRGHPPVSLRFR